MKETDTKKVTKKDTRPKGKPDECFYCQEKVGDKHRYECVCNDHKVKVRYSFDLDIEVPRSWDKDMIEFHRNDGTWCASNALNELKKLDKKLGCLCCVFKCEVLESEQP